jgi:hypothetical protein
MTSSNAERRPEWPGADEHVPVEELIAARQPIISSERRGAAHPVNDQLVPI